jgi:hypothetical protein
LGRRFSGFECLAKNKQENEDIYIASLSSSVSGEVLPQLPWICDHQNVYFPNFEEILAV